MKRAWIVSLVVCGSLTAAPARADDVKVTVVAILATERNATVDEKVKCIADEVKKLYPNLTGFRQAETITKNLSVGKNDTFKLVDAEVATVTVDEATDQEGKVRLTIKPPQVGQISYSTCCGKCFPIITGYKTKAGDLLIIAVMVKPCPVKKN